MNELKALLELDFKYLLVGFVLLLVVIKFVWTLLEWLIVEKLKRKNRDKERLS